MPSTLRRNPRKTLFRLAWIYSGQRSEVVECAVDDISHNGAKLVVTEAKQLADEFSLLFCRDGRVARNCRVAWKLNNQVGVEFTGRNL